MPYNYQTARHDVFTESGLIMYVSIRDRVKHLLTESGAVRMGEIIQKQTEDSWTMLACVDRMVELGDLVEIPNTYCKAGQDRIFVGKYS